MDTPKNRRPLKTRQAGWAQGLARALGAAGLSPNAISTIGVLLAALGVAWTLQGLGYVTGSPMTGVGFWAIVGPLVAGLGVALGYVALRGPRK